jgi:hypothetical protein
MSKRTAIPTLFTDSRRISSEEMRLRIVQGEIIPREELIAFLLEAESDIRQTIKVKNGPPDDVDFF